MNARYGYIDNGPAIIPPKGWKIIPEGYEVPNSPQREFIMVYDGRHRTWDGWWCDSRRGLTTMSPIWACVWGGVRAIAVPEDFDLSKLKNYEKEIARNKNYKGIL